MVWGLVALEIEALVSGKSRRTGIFTLAAGMVRGREARKKKKKKKLTRLGSYLGMYRAYRQAGTFWR